MPALQDFFSRVGNTDVSRMLSVQYRMNHCIMDWSSQMMYGGNVTAHPSVADHTLADMPVNEPLHSSLKARHVLSSLAFR